MARNKSKPAKFEFKGFINLDFTIEERVEISKWMVSFGESPVDAVIVLVEAGWKVGISWDDYHQTTQVSVTCKDTASKYCGYCLTLRHDDPGKGLLVLRYVYDSMLKDETLPLKDSPKDFAW